jgi:hypothetical protein
MAYSTVSLSIAPIPHGEGFPTDNIPVVSLSEEASVSLKAGDNEDFFPSKCYQTATCL